MLTESGTRIKVNNLSVALREKLEKKILTYSKKVRYKFKISHRNPDPEKHGGAVIYPSFYMLQPVTFFIDDKWTETKDGKEIQRIERRKIGLPTDAMDQHGDPAGFNSIHIKERDAGIFELNLDNAADRDKWAYMELHPEHSNGMFGGPNGLFEHIDEKSDAKRRVDLRRKKDDAMSVAVNFSLKEVKDFAAAMGWNEFEDDEILQDKIQDLAEKDPDFFTTFVEEKNYHYRAVVTRAENAGLWSWVPTEYKYIWTTSGETIVAFGRSEGQDRIERMSDWLMTDKTGILVFEKIKSMLKVKYTKPAETAEA
jgi:hypothetical protein